MALVLKTSNGYGYEAEYHRVTAVNVDLIRDTATATVSTYKDEASRRAGKSPIESLQVSLGDSAALLVKADNAVAQAYEELKKKAEFQGAADA